MSYEMWNSVRIFGPQSEIERFKELCIVQAPAGDPDGTVAVIDFASIIPIPAVTENELCWILNNWGTAKPWNFRQVDNLRRGLYWFAFDTFESFPIPILERLAQLFPRLAFDCDCIADDDSSMGFGWFNTPQGGEDFHDGYDVPGGYWEENSGIKREPLEQLRYLAVLARMEGNEGDAADEF